MKLQTLSDDLVGMMGGLLDNQALGKLLFYTVSNPLNQPNLNLVDLAPFGAFERILPHPFDIEYNADIRSQLHIYFPRLAFVNNEIVENALVFFDIVCHKSIWTFRDDNNRKKIRPIEVARHIIYEMKDVCSFIEMTHLDVNTDYQCLRLEAELIRWNDKNANNY